MSGETLKQESQSEPNPWERLQEIKMRSPNAGEPWTNYPDAMEEIDESEPDINGVPQTVWRGERLYLNNIDELGKRDLSTTGYERKNNREGELFLSRDKSFASTYAVGKDGVKYYDEPLSVEEIPIGVIYKIDNHDNHLEATPTDDEPEFFGPFAGKFREFTAKEVPADSYEVSEIQIMDDFVANDHPQDSSSNSPYKYSGHVRSDFRSPLEVYKIKDQSELPVTIEKVKKRMFELDEERKK